MAHSHLDSRFPSYYFCGIIGVELATGRLVTWGGVVTTPWLEVLLGVAASGVTSLFVSEIADTGARAARLLVRRAVRRLPSEHRQRYEEEFLSELDALSDGFRKVLYAAQISMRMGRLRRVLAESKINPELKHPSPGTRPIGLFRSLIYILIGVLSLTLGAISFSLIPVAGIDLASAASAGLGLLGVFVVFYEAIKHRNSSNEKRRDRDQGTLIHKNGTDRE